MLKTWVEFLKHENYIVGGRRFLHDDVTLRYFFLGGGSVKYMAVVKQNETNWRNKASGVYNFRKQTYKFPFTWKYFYMSEDRMKENENVCGFNN